MSLNALALRVCESSLRESDRLRIVSHDVSGGGRWIDFGCETPGGLEAGVALARVCMADLAQITVHPPDRSIGPWPIVQVVTDHPLRACMGAQYAGWKVAVGDFFAMGSGPMRARRGREDVLERHAISDTSEHVVGVLETEQAPGPDVVARIAQECLVPPSAVTLCVAPTRSIAGVVQVVSRSVETALHKLFELGLDLGKVISAHGTAPLPPVAKDFAKGIGRTNDAILYGGHVTLWVDGDDALLREMGPRVPSSSSRDYGQPFAQTFKKYQYDFYQVDPGLFAPAMLTLVNMKSGKSFRFGSMNPEVLANSFEEAFA